MDLIHSGNYEHIRFESEDFPFNCFFIQNQITLPHWHNHLELIYPISGSCHVYINGSIHPCCREHLLVVPPGSLHSIVPQEACDYYAIVIGEGLLTPLSQDQHLSALTSPLMAVGGFLPLCLESGSTGYDELICEVGQLIHLNKHKALHYQALIKSRLILLFEHILTHAPGYFQDLPSRSLTGSALQIKEALEYLYAHYHEKISIGVMSRYSHMSEQHFSRLFKACTGRTFVEYLTLFRLEQARKLLRGTDLPITRIPELTGFCNGNYFSRVYKKHYGHAPSADR